MNNFFDIIGILIGGFIAYHVYFLSKRIDLKDRLVHKDNICNKIDPIMRRIYKEGYNSDIELVNVKKYYSHYPHNNEKNRHGYTYQKAEIKTLRFDGVEFFCGIKEVYKKPDGSLTFNGISGFPREDFNVYMVGLIPYEWIEYVNAQGDEYSYHPQFFTRFKGHKKSPYKYFLHYSKSEFYQNGDPPDFKYNKIEVSEK